MRRALVAMAALLLVACSTGEGGTLSKAAEETTTSTSTPPKPKRAADTEIRACDLVALDVVTEVLGEQAAIASEGTQQLNQCTWVRQAAIDDPSAARAGQEVSLTVVEPPPGAYSTAREYWRDLKAVVLDDGGTHEGGLGDDAVIAGSRIDARKGDVVLETNASLGDGVDAAAASRAVMSAALDSL